MKKIVLVLLLSCAALFAQEKSWIVQKWLMNCSNRVHDGVNFALGPLLFKRLNLSGIEMTQDCKTTLYGMLEYYSLKKEFTYSVRYFLDNGVELSQDMRDEIQRGIEEHLRGSLLPVIGSKMIVKNNTDFGAVDMSFLVYLSKFSVNEGAYVWYGRIEGNLYLNSLYNIEYPMGVAYYEGSGSLAQTLNSYFGGIIQDYALAIQEVMDKDFMRKYTP